MSSIFTSGSKKKEAPRDPTKKELRNGPSKEDLPEEVQSMDRADCVCRFCGVSYLVFSEMKAMEKRCKAAEAELKRQTERIAQIDDLEKQVTNLRNERNQHRDEVLKWKKFKDEAVKEWTAKCDVVKIEGTRVPQTCDLHLSRIFHKTGRLSMYYIHNK